MATATEPTHAEADGYVDFDEFIDFQISKTRSGIKATDLLTAFIGGAAAVLAYVLVFALFDHWIIEGGFGQSARYALLSLLTAGLLGWTVWKLLLPYFRKVTPLYAASQIERTQPDLKNSLLTLVDLKQAGRPVPETIETALEKRSARTLSHMDVDEAVDRRVLMRLSYVLFALVVLTCAYVLFSPKKLSNSLWRALLPASNVSVATRTRIDNVDPGNVEVLARAQLTVTADLSGEVPEQVQLLFTTTDRRFVDEPVAMRESDEGLRRFSGVITGENGAGILQNLTYRVVASDAQSDVFAVTVKQAPSATVLDVTYEYPEYMGLSERTQPGGAIDAWEGTFVNVRARANMPLKSAMISFSDTEDTSTKAEEIPAEVANGIDISARWRLKIRSDGTYAGFYRIQCRNEAGETDIEPTLYSIKIRPDLPPEIQLAQPTGDIERPANAVVPLLYAAEDRDFLLRSVILHMELNGDAVPQQPRLYQAPPFRKSLHDVYNLELESLGLDPGDRLTYWLEARDNMEPFADRSGNRANTPKLNITITEPATPEEVQEQLEEDQQQIADKLDEAAQQPNDEPDASQSGPEMGEDTEPPPPNPDQPAESGDEPQHEESAEQQTGDSGEQQQPADGQSGAGRQSGTSNEGQQAEQTQSGEGAGQDGSQDQPAGEESFDDLLERMMQREQQRQQEQSESGEQQEGQEQQQTGESGPQQANDGQNGQPGEKGESSGTPGGESPTGQPSQSPGPAGGGSSASPPNPQTGEPSPGSQSMNNDPDSSPGQSTDPNAAPQPGSSNEGTKPEPGEALGGEPTPTSEGTPPAGQKPANDGTSGDGQKQPGEDPSDAKPGDGTSNDGTQPKPGTAPPDPLSDQPGPKPGDPADTPDAKSGGQPDGPDEPMQGEGDPQGQRSDKPQTGEAGDSQQTSQGNQGGDQKGPGDSTGQKGSQETSDQRTGQPGSQNPGDGSQQQPNGSKSDGEGTQPGAQKGAPNQGEPSSGESTQAPQDGESAAENAQPGGEQPEMTGDSPPGSQGQSGEGQQPSGDNTSQPGESGGNQPSDDQSAQPGDSGGQSGQPGDSPSQPGGQPGSPPSGGTPSGAGSGTSSDGRSGDETNPIGQGGGGDGAPADGAGTAGEGAAPNLEPENPDLEAKKKAANLVLERLQQQLQRGEMDPELREDLNLTPEQLREFTRKLEQRLGELSSEDTSPEAEARRRQFEETLRTIDFGSKGTTREGGDGPREAASGFAGPNRPAPPEHRDAERLYRERLMKKQRSRQ